MKATLISFLVIILVGLTAAVSLAAPVDQLLEQYYLIQKNLASDSVGGTSAAATEIAKISRQSAGTTPQAKAQLNALAEVAAKFQAGDLKAARNGFGDLSDRMIACLQAVGAKRNPPYQYYCPMVKKNWLQPDKGVHNPYYGSSMPTCGELVQVGQSANPPAQHHDH